MGRMWCGISVRIYNFVERVKGSSFGGSFLCQVLFHQKSDFEVELQPSVLRFAGLVERSAVGLAEQSLRSEDGRTADIAELGGWE